jgi:hypothetical protein
MEGKNQPRLSTKIYNKCDIFCRKNALFTNEIKVTLSNSNFEKLFKEFEMQFPVPENFAFNGIKVYKADFVQNDEFLICKIVKLQ